MGEDGTVTKNDLPVRRGTSAAAGDLATTMAVEDLTASSTKRGSIACPAVSEDGCSPLAPASSSRRRRDVAKMMSQPSRRAAVARCRQTINAPANDAGARKRADCRHQSWQSAFDSPFHRDDQSQEQVKLYHFRRWRLRLDVSRQSIHRARYDR